MEVPLTGVSPLRSRLNRIPPGVDRGAHDARRLREVGALEAEYPD